MYWILSFIGSTLILIGLFNPLLFVIGILIVGTSTWKIHTNQSKGKTRHISEISGGEDVIFKPGAYSSNPWVKRMAESPLFGEVPKNIVELMHRVSADPNEKVISSLWVSHGLIKKGYLVLTTLYLRWIKVTPSGDEDTFFPLDTVLDKHRHELEVVDLDAVLLINDLQFQARGNKKKANEFIKLYSLTQQALLHEDRANDHNKTNSEGVKKHSDIADEIGKLATLKERNIITEEEFKAGKQRLLTEG
jgi:hypothetical protein